MVAGEISGGVVFLLVIAVPVRINIPSPRSRAHRIVEWSLWSETVSIPELRESEK